MTSAKSLHSSRPKAKCARCGVSLCAPDWSEPVDAHTTVYLWRCWCCGNQFETSDHRETKAPPVEELVEEFLPNLLVG